MKNLLKKELLLAMHPTAPLFLLFSIMMLIPNYPYYVVFFYAGLAVFFICLNGRENNDVFYTLSLPISKRSVVKARMSFVVFLELLQILLAVPFAILRQKMPVGGNAVGMDANIALFGFSFILLGLFNYSFFSIYYKNANQVGKAFVVSSIIVFVYIIIAEAATYIVPFMKNLDTPDPLFLPQKIAALAVGFTIYVLLTFLVYKKSLKNFEIFDLLQISHQNSKGAG